MISLKLAARVLVLVLVTTTIAAENTGDERSPGGLSSELDGRSVEFVDAPHIDFRSFLMAQQQQPAIGGQDSVARPPMSYSDDDHWNIDLNKLNQAYRYDTVVDQEPARAKVPVGGMDAARVNEARGLLRLFHRMRQANYYNNEQPGSTFFGSQWKRNFRSLIPKEDKDYSFVGYVSKYDNVNGAGSGRPLTSSSSSSGGGGRGGGGGGWRDEVLRDYMRTNGPRLTRFTNEGVGRGSPRLVSVSRTTKNDFATNNNNKNNIKFDNDYPAVSQENREKRIKCKMPVSAGVKNPANCEIDSYLNSNAYDDFGTSWDPVGRR